MPRKAKSRTTDENDAPPVKVARMDGVKQAIMFKKQKPFNTGYMGKKYKRVTASKEKDVNKRKLFEVKRKERKKVNESFLFGKF